jgi:uncharacterized OB-fold protein
MISADSVEGRLSDWPFLPATEESDFGPYWDSLRRGIVALPRCRGCGRFQWYPLPCCPACQSLDFEWSEIGPDATVYSFTTVRRAFLPGFDRVLPLTIVILVPDDAPHVHFLALSDPEADDAVSIGDRVRLAALPFRNGVSLPIARVSR